jgi:hypothetical protein
MSVSQRNLSGYDLPVIEWERVRRTLGTDHTQAPGTGGPDRHTSWLTTTNPDGTSHVRPVGTVQVDGDALTAEYSAPSAGPPPWWLFRINSETVYAFGTDEPGGAIKYEMGEHD